MTEKKIRIIVETDGGESKIEGLKSSLEGAEKSAEKLGDKYSGSIKKSSLAVEELDKRTGGLASTFLDVGDAAKKAGGKITGALISSGIGAAVALVGLLFNYWEDIADAIDGTVKSLNNKIISLERALDISNHQYDILKLQEENLKLQGKDVTEIRDAQIEVLQIQLEQNLKLLETRQRLLEINQERNKEVSLMEKAKLLYAALFNQSAFGLELVKAKVKNDEESFKITEQIQSLETENLRIQNLILSIKNKANKEDETGNNLIKERQDLLNQVDALQKEYLNTALDAQRLELQAVRDKYNGIIDEAKKNNIDTIILEEAKREALQEIDQKYKDLAIEKEQEFLFRKQEILDSYEVSGIEANIARIEQQAERDIAELERLGAHKEEIEAVEKASNERINAIVLKANQEKADESAKIAEEEAKNKIETEELLKDAKISIASSTLDILSNLAEEGSDLARGVAAAQATMNTYQGVTAALSATSVIPEPFGTALKFANAAAIGVAGFVNVKKILDTKSVESSAPNGGGAAGAAPAPPSFDLVQGTESNQISESIQGSNEPIRAVVVAGDVTTAQQVDRNIVDGSSL